MTQLTDEDVGLPRPPAVFVGRAEELALFERATEELRLVLVFGLGGMGKTSFVLQAAEALAQRRGARRAYHVCRPGESLATVATAVLEQLGAPERAAPGPVEALLRVAQAQPLVVCLDDAQRVGEGPLFDGLAHLAARRRPLWFCVASREALPISPVAVDHLVLRLGGLAPDEASVLWAALERLYGPAPTPPATGGDAPATGRTPDPAAHGAGAGNPFLIKQAFAGPVHAPGDPLGLDELAELEAELLAQVCAFRRPVAAKVVTAALLEPGRDAAQLQDAPHGTPLAALERNVQAAPRGTPLAALERNVQAAPHGTPLAALERNVQAAPRGTPLAALERNVQAAPRGTPLAALERNVQAALVQLQRRFLVDAQRHTLGAHDLVREAVARSRRPVERRHHLRCLAHHRTLPDDETTELELLHHAVAAGDVETAHAILQRHASYLRRLMPASAVVERELARAIDELAAAAPSPGWLHLLGLRIAARQGQAAAVCPELARLSAAGDPLAALDHGEIAFALGRLDEAEASLARAVADAELGGIAQLWALGVLCQVHRARAEWDRIDALFASAAGILAQSGLLGDAVRSWMQGLVADDRQQYREAAAELAVLRRAIESMPGLAAANNLLQPYERAVAAALGKPLAPGESAELFDETLFFRLLSRMLRVCELRYLGQLREALALAGSTREAAAAAGYRAIEWWALWLWGEAALLVGASASVAALLEPAARLAGDAGHHGIAARLRGAVVRGAWASGHLGAALDGAAALEQQLGSGGVPAGARLPGTVARNRAVAALAHAAAGRLDRAREALGGEEGAQGHDLAEWRLARLELHLWSGAASDAGDEAAELRAFALEAGWRWVACRALLLGAEAALRRADPAGVTLLEQARAEAVAAGYVPDRALAGLLAAVAARLRGDRDEATRELRLVAGTGDDSGGSPAPAGAPRGPDGALPPDAPLVTAPAAATVAVAVAVAADAGPSVAPVLEREAAAAALVALAGNTPPDGAGARLARRLQLSEPCRHQLTVAGACSQLTDEQLAQLDLAAFDLVIDVAERSVRLGARTIDFTRSGTLLDIVQALSRPPGALVPTGTLVQQVWGMDHHPLRHHSRVTMAFSRLRRLLGPDVVEGTPDGYRLQVAGRWALLEPLAPRP